MWLTSTQYPVHSTQSGAVTSHTHHLPALPPHSRAPAFPSTQHGASTPHPTQRHPALPACATGCCGHDFTCQHTHQELVMGRLCMRMHAHNRVHRHLPTHAVRAVCTPSPPALPHLRAPALLPIPTHHLRIHPCACTPPLLGWHTHTHTAATATAVLAGVL